MLLPISDLGGVGPIEPGGPSLGPKMLKEDLGEDPTPA